MTDRWPTNILWTALTSLSSSGQPLIKLFDIYNVCKLTQQEIPSSDVIWLYETHNSSSVAATSSSLSIYITIDTVKYYLKNKIDVRKSTFLILFLPSERIFNFVNPDKGIILSIIFVDNAKRLWIKQFVKKDSKLIYSKTWSKNINLLAVY